MLHHAWRLYADFDTRSLAPLWHGHSVDHRPKYVTDKKTLKRNYCDLVPENAQKTCQIPTISIFFVTTEGGGDESRSKHVLSVKVGRWDTIPRHTAFKLNDSGKTHSEIQIKSISCSHLYRMLWRQRLPLRPAGNVYTVPQAFYSSGCCTGPLRLASLYGKVETFLQLLTGAKKTPDWRFFLLQLIVAERFLLFRRGPKLSPVTQTVTQSRQSRSLRRAWRELWRTIGRVAGAVITSNQYGRQHQNFRFSDARGRRMSEQIAFYIDINGRLQCDKCLTVVGGQYRPYQNTNV